VKEAKVSRKDNQDAAESSVPIVIEKEIDISIPLPFLQRMQ